MTAMTTQLPMVLAEVSVASTRRLSPSFVRLELASPELADMGVEGPWLDQRFKLVVPDPVTGGLSGVEGADETWWTSWLERPVSERGHMRTYSVRDVVGSGADTRLVVDVVLHPAGADGGPGADWAERAEPGDRAVVVAPRRGVPFGGIEFAPPAGSRLLLVGDETAVPAICRVLEDLPEDARGSAYLEVPQAGDVQSVRVPDGVEVTWLVRGAEPHGSRVHAAVLEHLGEPPAAPPVVAHVDPDLWETPTWSSSGEEIPEGPDSAALVPESPEDSARSLEDLYAWIAGESAMVTGLRRHLVKEMGIDRRQVCFMGYWRRGVAMRS